MRNTTNKNYFLFTQPQRAITYIKANYPAERFEKTFLLLWHHLYYLHRDISNPEVFARLLTEDAHFTPSEAETIIAAANDKKWKDALLAKTQEALDRGSFGAPWFWVVNKNGEESMFFGSDRFVDFASLCLILSLLLFCKPAYGLYWDRLTLLGTDFITYGSSSSCLSRISKFSLKKEEMILNYEGNRYSICYISQFVC